MCSTDNVQCEMHHELGVSKCAKATIDVGETFIYFGGAETGFR